MFMGSTKAQHKTMKIRKDCIKDNLFVKNKINKIQFGNFEPNYIDENAINDPIIMPFLGTLYSKIFTGGCK